MTDHSFIKTALIHAAQQGHDDVAMLLLADGRVNPNAATAYGRTAPVLAARMGHENMVAILLADRRVVAPPGLLAAGAPALTKSGNDDVSNAAPPTTTRMKTEQPPRSWLPWNDMHSRGIDTHGGILGVGNGRGAKPSLSSSLSWLGNFLLVLALAVSRPWSPLFRLRSPSQKLFGRRHSKD